MPGPFRRGARARELRRRRVVPSTRCRFSLDAQQRLAFGETFAAHGVHGHAATSLAVPIVACRREEELRAQRLALARDRTPVAVSAAAADRPRAPIPDSYHPGQPPRRPRSAERRKFRVAEGDVQTARVCIRDRPSSRMRPSRPSRNGVAQAVLAYRRSRAFNGAAPRRRASADSHSANCGFALAAACRQHSIAYLEYKRSARSSAYSAASLHLGCRPRASACTAQRCARVHV